MRELVHTDLPEPVVPAMSTWGSLAMSPTMSLFPMSRPTAKATEDLCWVKARDSMTSRISTGETVLLGTSMPTTEIFSGMGAMRTAAGPQGQGDVVGQVGDLAELHPLVQTNS